MANRIRIIGGQWRGRQILFEDAPGLRPTPSRIRETLFNWLQLDVAGSRCLDLYAGSGALGFEAASRGAKEVWQVENHPNACRWIRDNAGTLAASSINLVERDVSTFCKAPRGPSIWRFSIRHSAVTWPAQLASCWKPPAG
ncbi:RsmD family RNA methyltransferase [Methylomonas sp. CM2]|uniref:RsmD family RNA methyltransferase n=1 Tax=Methylomonas sp. CM2 TaxID=3417647 RepID=UPI003CF9D67B